MTYTKQLRIIRRLATLLEGITSFTYKNDANADVTVNYDLVGRVWRGRSVITQDDAEDALSILEAPRPIIGAPAGHAGLRRKETWTLLVQGWPKDDKKNPSDPAYILKAAVEQRLSRIVELDDQGMVKFPEVASLFERDIITLTIGQGVVRPPEDQLSRLAMFYLPLILEITTDVANPSA